MSFTFWELKSTCLKKYILLLIKKFIRNSKKGVHLYWSTFYTKLFVHCMGLRLICINSMFEMEGEAGRGEDLWNVLIFSIFQSSSLPLSSTLTSSPSIQTYHKGQKQEVQSLNRTKHMNYKTLLIHVSCHWPLGQPALQHFLYFLDRREVQARGHSKETGE